VHIYIISVGHKDAAISALCATLEDSWGKSMRNDCRSPTVVHTTRECDKQADRWT
jgi:hypothetical protein